MEISEGLQCATPVTRRRQHGEHCECNRSGVKMALNSKFDDRQRAPGIDDDAAGIKPFPHKEQRQCPTGHHIKSHENSLEEEEVARRKQVAQHKDCLCSCQLPYLNHNRIVPCCAIRHRSLFVARLDFSCTVSGTRNKRVLSGQQRGPFPGP